MSVLNYLNYVNAYLHNYNSNQLFHEFKLTLWVYQSKIDNHASRVEGPLENLRAIKGTSRETRVNLQFKHIFVTRRAKAHKIQLKMSIVRTILLNNIWEKKT